MGKVDPDGQTDIPQGLVIVEGATITHVHTADGTVDLDALADYVDDYDLGVEVPPADD